MPTLLFKNESTQQGELWRMRGVYDRTGITRDIWDEFCPPDVDVYLYDGLPISEIVFWHEQGIVELPAWKMRLERPQENKDALQTVLQH